MKKIKNPVLRVAAEYGLITVSMLIMTVGVYFFKFPNHFAFGGVTGYSALIEAVTPWSASLFTNVVNNLLLVAGFIFLGKSVGFKTVYATIVMSVGLAALQEWCPMSAPLTDQPILELVFAIFLPALSSAVLFNINASGGGTDIIAMILKKHTSLNIGTALLVVDVASVVLAFFVFGPETGLFSVLGLIAKALVIDQVIENMNLCKCFTIVCDDPEPITEYIIKTIKRTATVYKAEGAFSHRMKTVILVTMNRHQAVMLRNFIRITEPTAFIMISNSSEIIGKGFMSR